MLYHVVSAFSIVVYWRIIRQKYFHNTITLLNNPSYITFRPKWMLACLWCRADSHQRFCSVHWGCQVGYRLSKTYYVIFHTIQHSGGHHSLHNSCQPYNFAEESPLVAALVEPLGLSFELWTWAWWLSVFGNLFAALLCCSQCHCQWNSDLQMWHRCMLSWYYNIFRSDRISSASVYIVGWLVVGCCGSHKIQRV